MRTPEPTMTRVIAIAIVFPTPFPLTSISTRRRCKDEKTMDLEVSEEWTRRWLVYSSDNVLATRHFIHSSTAMSSPVPLSIDLRRIPLFSPFLSSRQDQRAYKHRSTVR